MGKYKFVSMPFAAALLCAQAAQAESIDDICKAGAQEPPVVVYSIGLPDRNEAFFNAFSAAYPDIKTEYLRMTSGQMATRYASERQAGVVNADIVIIADAVFAQEGIRQGWFAKFDKDALPSLANVGDAHFSNGVGIAAIQPAGIIYNTDMAGEGGIQSWEDVLKPEFRGKIALASPRSVTNNMAIFKLLRAEFGDEYFAKLMEQQPAMLDSSLPGTQQVAAGGLAIVMPAIETGVPALKADGAPIAIAFPEPVTGFEYSAMLSDGSDSPNAAKCVYNYLFSVEGQSPFVGPTGVSIIGAPGTAAMPERYSSPNIAAITDEEKNEIARLLNIQ